MESDPVRLKKLILNSFGEYTDTEISLDASGKIFTGKEDAGKTIIDAVVGALFGYPPGRREEFLGYAPPEGTGKRFCASLLLATDDGTEYLIGKDFHHGQLEVFRQEGFRLKHLFPATVMEILRKELGTLNPLDFEALYVFPAGAAEIREDAPVIREEWQKITNKTKEDAGFLSSGGVKGFWENEAAAASESSDAVSAEFRERIKGIEDKSKKIKDLTEELSRINAERKELALYEPFLTNDRGTRLEELSQQLTDAALERKYLEEKIRENRENEGNIRREIDDLKKKTAAFPEEFLSPEFQEQVRQLAKKKEEKVALLKKWEDHLKEVSRRKGFFSRRPRREERLEIEGKIICCTEEIGTIRHKLATMLKKKTMEEFFRGLELHQKYLEDLDRLEKHPIHKTDNYKQEQRRLLQREAEIRREMQDLLSLAGSEEYKVLKEKIGLLQDLRVKEREIEEEIEKLGGNTEKALAALEAEKRRLQEEEKESRKSQKPLPEPVEDDSFLSLYRRVGDLTEKLTGGEYTGILPEIRDGKYLLYAREKASAAWVPDESLTSGKRDLVRLAFRLFLARFHTPARSFPLFFAAPSFFDNRENSEKLPALLKEFIPEAQIIAFVPETATGERQNLFM